MKLLYKCKKDFWVPFAKHIIRRDTSNDFKKVINKIIKPHTVHYFFFQYPKN